MLYREHFHAMVVLEINNSKMCIGSEMCSHISNSKIFIRYLLKKFKSISHDCVIDFNCTIFLTTIDIY